MDQKGVSNNNYWRDKSDKLDSSMGWTGQRKEQSGTRGVIHGVYHTGVGIGKYATGNSEGGKAEMNRASDQFGKSKNIGSTPPKK